MPAQHAPSGTLTSGARRERLSDDGISRLRKRSAQNGHPAGHPVGVRLGVADEPPPRPLVELVFKGTPVRTRCIPGRNRQVTELYGQQLRKELSVKQHRLPAKGPDAALVGHELQGLLDTSPGQPMAGGLRLTQRIARIPDDVIDVMG